MTPCLQLRISGRVVQVIALGDRPVRVGRAASNDLVVSDERVSGFHLVAWATADGIFVEDLRSRNGVRVDGEPVVGVQQIRDGQILALGTGIELVVDAPAGASGSAPTSLHVELVGTPLRTPITRSTFDIGSSVNDDLRIPDAEEQEVTLLVAPDGEVMIGRALIEGPLALGETFKVGSQALRVVRAPSDRQVTRAATGPEPQFRLTVVTKGARAPSVILEDPARGGRWEVERDNRAVLLFLLARRRVEDLEAGRDPDQVGWIGDEEVALGVWGKGRPAADTNGLNVLVYRIRREVRSEGIDPWFLEKRQGRLRVVADTRIE